MIAERMFHARSIVLNRISQGRKEVVAMSRFFNNESVALSELISANQEACLLACEDRDDLLVVHDTTDFNYKDKAGKFSVQDPHIGPTGHQGSEVGFFDHTSLVLDARSGFPLGIADIHLWNRTFNQATRQERRYKSLPIEEKESFKWINCMRSSSALLSKHKAVTHVMDRDADIFELFAEPCLPGHHLLVRQCRERKVGGESGKLSVHLDELATQFDFELEVKANSHREKRKAKMQLSFAPVTLKRPANCPATYPAQINLWVIQVKEHASSVPRHEKPIQWVLYTTHEVATAQAALKIVRWYTCRWTIEEFFSLLKTKGLDMESSQLETGAALKKLCVMSSQVALAIMQLIKDRGNEYGYSARLLISESDLRFVFALIQSLEGKTQAQKNPYPPKSLAWLAWSIARLGGWKGYASEAPPGPKTMSRGLQQFWQRLEGWKLMEVFDGRLE